MKPPPFDYVRPATVAEALELLDDPSLEIKPLAGGQSLVPVMNFRLARPDRLVDVNRLGELAYIRRSAGVLRIGALTRQRALERSPLVAEHWSLLRDAIDWVAHPQIRNRGTVGGSIAHADPAAELPVALVALDAVVHALSHRRGARAIPAAELFVTHLTTALEPDELLVEIEVPAVAPRTGTAFTEFARRHGDYGLGGAAVSVTLDPDGRVERSAIALLAAGPVPVRASGAEAALAGRAPDAAAAREAAAAAVEGIEPTGDIHGGTRYRRDLIRTLVERGIVKAAQEARA